jgi:undecaprenyl-diphosphatase
MSTALSPLTPSACSRADRDKRRLTATAAVAASGFTFGVLLLLVRLQWRPLESVDHGLAADLNNSVAGHHILVAVLRAVTTLGNPGIVTWLVVLGTLILLVRRRYRLAGYLAVAGLGAAILDPALKLAVGRLRPVVADPIAHGTGNSFPSGHALGSSICYGALLLVFLPALPHRTRRPAVWAVAVLVAAIGVTRVMLGVHYLSDVVGAWCLGVAWLGLTAYTFQLWRHETGAPVAAPLKEGLEPEAAADIKPVDPAAPPSSWNVVARAAALVVVAWVLVFGAVAGIGHLVLTYGGNNLLGDHTVPHYLAAHRTPRLNSASNFWSNAGNTHAILAVGVVAGALALAIVRRWRPVVFLLVLMFGKVALFLAVAATIDRDRPDVPQLDPYLPTSSYPSGHVSATICLYAGIVLLTVPRTRAWWRWLTLVPAILMPLLVAASRLYRGEHHPTDVLGSLVLSALWVTATYLAIRPNADIHVPAAATPRSDHPQQTGRHLELGAAPRSKPTGATDVAAR